MLLRSPVTGMGLSHGGAQVGAATTDGFIFDQARKDKASAYPELASDTARHEFLVLGNEVGGRFSKECVDLVKQLAILKTQSAPAGGSKVLKLIYFRRWWGILSVAVQRAVAMDLLGGDRAPAMAS